VYDLAIDTESNRRLETILKFFVKVSMQSIMHVYMYRMCFALALLFRLPLLGAPAGVDGSFSTDIEGPFTWVLQAVVMQSDGKILVGGEIETVNGIPRTGIARLNSDGSLDESFNPVILTPVTSPVVIVTAIAVQSDQKIVIGGDFANVNGVARTNLARLNADGSLDLDFSRHSAG
jgi:uncharacterized delta-60 repeat protein